MTTNAYETVAIHVSPLTGSGQFFVINTHRTIVIIISGRAEKQSS